MHLLMKKVIQIGDCLIWQGCVNSDGYPKLTRKLADGSSSSNIKGHRYVYECTKGEIPEGHVIRHTCDNTLCLNPDHLITGTMTDNMRDRQERRRTSNFVTDEVNELIINLRRDGLPQWKVAKLVGCSQMHISKLERKAYKLK